MGDRSSFFIREGREASARVEFRNRYAHFDARPPGALFLPLLCFFRLPFDSGLSRPSEKYLRMFTFLFT